MMKSQSTPYWHRIVLVSAIAGIGLFPVTRGLRAEEPAKEETKSASEEAKPAAEEQKAETGKEEEKKPEGQPEAPAPEENSEPADPEMTALQKQDEELGTRTDELAGKWKGTTDASERETIKAQLMTAINEHFDVRQKMREREIANLEKEVEQLRKTLTKRNELRDKIVERRAADLLGQDDEDLGF